MNSSRLPGKVLKKICNKSVLEHIYLRLKSIKKIEDIIIGTSLNKKDDQLCDWMKKKNIRFVRHSPEDDLLGRVHQVSESNHFDYLVKINADCPLVDPILIENALNEISRSKINFDIVTNRKIQTFPLGYSYEIISKNCINKCVKENLTTLEKELFVNWIFSNKNYKVKNISSKLNFKDINLCLDTEMDFILINEIYEKFWYSNNIFGLDDIKNFIMNNRKKYVFQK